MPFSVFTAFTACPLSVTPAGAMAAAGVRLFTTAKLLFTVKTEAVPVWQSEVPQQQQHYRMQSGAGGSQQHFCAQGSTGGSGSFDVMSCAGISDVAVFKL